MKYLEVYKELVKANKGLRRIRAKWLPKGIKAAQRQNKSGCVCRFDEKDNIIELCTAHNEYFIEKFDQWPRLALGKFDFGKG